MDEVRDETMIPYGATGRIVGGQQHILERKELTHITPHILGGLTPPGGGGGKRTRNRLFSDGGSPADEGRVLPWWLRRRYLHLWLQS